LSALGIQVGRPSVLEFESGVFVRGKLEGVERRGGKLTLLRFSQCTVNYGDRILFRPEWGDYDMAVGERIVSVFNGAADKDAFHQVALIPKERTIKQLPDKQGERLQELYRVVRNIRDSRKNYDKLEAIWNEQQQDYPSDWLLSMEILEILRNNNVASELQKAITEFLKARQVANTGLSVLIDWGFRLIDYHKADLETAA
ncbi:MAG: phenylalanine 4-monooxygenase, partial [Verrucomicrobiota bacterium]|nr:phenylalanine 4-monooxygenase [Verrucomicrobiota bacterium]